MKKLRINPIVSFIISILSFVISYFLCGKETDSFLSGIYLITILLSFILALVSGVTIIYTRKHYKDNSNQKDSIYDISDMD